MEALAHADRPASVRTSLKVACFALLCSAGPVALYLLELSGAALASGLMAWAAGVLCSAAILGWLLAPLYRRAAPRRGALILLGTGHTLATLPIALCFPCAALAGLTSPADAPWPIADDRPVSALDLFGNWYSGLGLGLAAFSGFAGPIFGIALGLGQGLTFRGRPSVAETVPERAAPAALRTSATRIGALWGLVFGTTALFFGFLVTLTSLAGSRGGFALATTLSSCAVAIAIPALAARRLASALDCRTLGKALLSGLLAVGLGVLASLATVDLAIRLLHGQESDSLLVFLWRESNGWLALFLLPGFACGWHLHRAAKSSSA